MITQTFESDSSRRDTVKELTHGGKNVSEFQDATVSSADADNAVFYSLHSSELLKHLLNASGNKKSNIEEVSAVQDSRNVRGRGTCKKASGAKNDSSRRVNKSSYSSFVSHGKKKHRSSTCAVSQIPLINKIGLREAGSLTETSKRDTSFSQSGKHGRMDVSEFNFDNSSYQTTAQYTNSRENLNRHFSDESSTTPSEIFPEDDFGYLSKEILSNEAMDFILNEAERALRIQSSPSSQESDCELTELLPAASCSSYLNTSSTFDNFPSPTSSQTGSSFSPAGAIPPEINISDLVNKTKESANVNINENNSDSDVDDTMVLVPSGTFNFNFNL